MSMRMSREIHFEENENCTVCGNHIIWLPKEQYRKHILLTHGEQAWAKINIAGFSVLPQNSIFPR